MPSPSRLRRIRVRLRGPGRTSYPVHVGSGLLPSLSGHLRKIVPAHRYFLVTDSNVGRLYGRRCLSRMRRAGLDAHLLTVPAGEKSKTRETKSRLEDRILALGGGRDSAVVALGGGMIYGPGRVHRRHLSPRHPRRPGSHHAPGDGGRRHRREDRRGPPPGQEPDRRLPPAARRPCRRGDAGHPFGAGVPVRPGRSGEDGGGGGRGAVPQDGEIPRGDPDTPSRPPWPVSWPPAAG